MARPPSANSILRNMKKESRVEIKTPIATDMFLPNHSGIASHPEFTNAIEDFWTNTSTNTGTNKTLNDFSNFVGADKLHFQGRNESGSTMTIGTPVYISGYNIGLDRILISLADANGSGTMPAIGLVEDDTILNNADGHIINSGALTGLDTSAWSQGDSLWVSETPGVLTNTKPTATNTAVQAVAIVLRSHVNMGVLGIVGAGRTNDIPNEADRDFSMGNNDLTKVKTIDVGAGVPATTDEINIDDNGGVSGSPRINFNDSRTIFGYDGGNTSALMQGGSGKGVQIRVDAGTLIADFSTGSGMKMNTIIDMDSNKIIGVTDPTNNQDAATKKYADDTFLLSGSADIGVGLQLTQDNSSADTQFTPQVLYNTDDTPPAASGFPIGTIYIQYTA